MIMQTQFGFNITRQPPQISTPFVELRLLPRLLLIIGIFGLIVGVGLKDTYSPTPIATSQWVSLALQGNLLLLVIPLIGYRPTWGWFHPLIFGILLSLIDYLRDISLYLYGLPWHTALPNWSPDKLTSLIAYELSLNAVGQITYYLGFILMPKWGIPRLRFSNIQSLAKKVSGAVFFSIIVFVVYMYTRGGVIAHILSWGAGRQAALSGQFYWQLLIQIGLIACLIWLAIDRTCHRKWLFWLYIGLMLVMAFLIGGSRSAVIYPIIYMVIVWALRERKIPLTKIALVMVVSLALIGILGSFRNSTFTGEIGWQVLNPSHSETSSFSTGLEEISARSGSGRGVVPILARVPHDVNYLYGQSYLALLTVPLPRAFWPDKPGMVGGQVGRAFFGSDVGIPPGPIGESYWNFGLAGVIGVFFCFGAFHRWLATTFREYARQPASFVLYGFTVFLVRPTSADLLAWLLLLVPSFLILRMMGIWSGNSTTPRNTASSLPK